MSKILVTGGTGFIGAALVRRLVEQGHQVRVFDNNFRGAPRNLLEALGRVELVEGDICNYADVERSVDGMETVYHLAFINGTEYFYTKPELVLNVGIRGTMNVLDALAKQPVGTFIYASSSEVYQTPPVVPTPETVPAMIPDPKNPRYSYGGAKLLGEILTLHYLPKAAAEKRMIFRPHNIYGPAMGWKHVIPELMIKIFELSRGFSISHIDLPIQGDGSETRAFCFVDDAVKGIVTTCEAGDNGEIYHVGTQEEVTIRQLIQEMGHVLGIEVGVVPGELRPGGTTRRCPDIAKLARLGYSPKVSLRQGLERTLAWYKSELSKR